MVPAEPAAAERVQLDLHGQQQVLRGGRPRQAQEPSGPQRLQHRVLQDQPRPRGGGPAPARHSRHQPNQGLLNETPLNIFKYSIKYF